MNSHWPNQFTMRRAMKFLLSDRSARSACEMCRDVKNMARTWMTSEYANWRGVLFGFTLIRIESCGLCLKRERPALRLLISSCTILSAAIGLMAQADPQHLTLEAVS